MLEGKRPNSPLPDQNDNTQQQPDYLAPFYFKPININTAKVEILTTIKGVGPSLAQAIVEHRTEKGRIENVNDLMDIRGIGKKRAESLLSQITFGSQ